MTGRRWIPHAWLARSFSLGGISRLRPAAEGAPVEPTPSAVATSAPQALLILDRDRRVLDAGEGVERLLGRPRRNVIGRRIDLVPRRGGRGQLESPWPDGSVHLLEFSATPMPPGCAQLVALRDVTVHARDLSYPALRDPRHAAAADLRAGDEEIRALLDHAVIRVAAALGIDLAAVFEARGPRRRLLLRAGFGWNAGAVGTATVSGAPGSPVGQALVAGDPLILTDLRRAGLAARPSRLLHEHGVISGIETVIGGPAGPWGVLGGYARRPRFFTPDDVDFLRVVGDALTLAIDRARLDERLHAAVTDLEHVREARDQAVVNAGREAERRTRARITQLLHDEALQSLLAARQHLAVAARSPDRHDCVVRAREGVQRAIRELRGAVGALHPVAMEQRRLREAIQMVAGHQARQGGFTVAFDLALEPQEDCAPLLLSVIRELTANIAQHADAHEALVTLRAQGEDLVLEICDDGIGIAPGRLDAALAEGHIGLASMVRRVQALEGEVAIGAGPDGGTCVRVTLPRRVPAALEAETARFASFGGASE